MYITKQLIACLFLASANLCLAQEQVNVEGYVYEENNRGYLKNVKVIILKKNSEEVIATTKTNADGIFNIDLPRGKEYQILCEKKLFSNKKVKSPPSVKKPEKRFLSK